MKNLTKLTLSSALALGVAFAPPAIAQDGETETMQEAEQSPIQARAQQVVALINGEGDPQEIFTAGFLAAVPLSPPWQVSGRLQRVHRLPLIRRWPQLSPREKRVAGALPPKLLVKRAVPQRGHLAKKVDHCWCSRYLRESAAKSWVLPEIR